MSLIWLAIGTEFKIFFLKKGKLRNLEKAWASFSRAGGWDDMLGKKTECYGIIERPWKIVGKTSFSPPGGWRDLLAMKK